MGRVGVVPPFTYDVGSGVVGLLASRLEFCCGKPSLFWCHKSIFSLSGPVSRSNELRWESSGFLDTSPAVFACLLGCSEGLSATCTDGKHSVHKAADHPEEPQGPRRTAEHRVEVRQQKKRCGESP